MRLSDPRPALRLLLCLLCLQAAGAARAEEPSPVNPPAPPDASPPPEPPHSFDPFQGMDPDGRIPAVLRPPDLPNPERWRYTPEGRLKPGNIFQRFLVSSMIAPFVFYDSDVGVGFGVALVDIDFRQTRRREFAGAFLSYTTEGQQNYTFVWRRWLNHIELPDGGVLQEERSLLRAAGGYERSLTSRFFGIGPKTHEDDESSYRDSVGFFEFGIDYTWPDPGDDLVLSAGVSGEFHDLGDGHVEGEPNTSDAYPEIFDPADPSNLGSLQAGIRWDTRDSQVNPYKGWWVGGNVDALLLQDDGNVGAVWTLSGGKIFRVPGLFHRGGDPGEEHPPTDTIAVGLRSQLSSGDMPFYKLPMLGGSRYERGYIAGRWRDDASWVASLEYRFWLLPRGFPIPFTENRIRVERFGAALFYEAGAVADDFPSLFKSRVRSSYGVGLRATLERAAPFRADIGFSGDGINISAGFGLSF